MPALFGRSYFGRSKYGRGAWGRGGGIMPRLVGMGGLTFFKDFRSGSTPAEYAAGSPGGMYTCSRSATNPSTWIDANGVIQVSTTSDVPLFDYGYYDETGFHAKNMGYHAFRSSTNLKTNTLGVAHSSVSESNYSGSLLDYFYTSINVAGVVTLTVVDIPELINISGAKAQRFTYVGVPGDSTVKKCGVISGNIGGFVAGEKVTTSFYVRSQTGMSATFRVVAYSTPSYSYTIKNITVSNIVGSEFKKYEVTHTIAAGDTGFYFDIEARDIVNTTTVDFEVALTQIEKLPYATPFNPTKTTALTRNADVLEYEIAGNRNASEETVIVKFTSGSTFAGDGTTRYIIASDTKGRSVQKISFVAQLKSWPNITDNVSVQADTTTSPLLNTTYVYGFVFKHSSPYVKNYVNRVSEGEYDFGDWTNPAWGTYWTIGNHTSGTAALDGNIEAVAIFNRALTAEEVAYVSSIL